MKIKNDLIFLSIYFIKLSLSLNVVSISLQYYYENYSNFQSTKIPNNLYKSYLYSYTKLGEPEFIIKTLFLSENKFYFISPMLEQINENDLVNYYNFSKSNSFQNISLLNKYYVLSKNDIAAREKFIYEIYNLEKKMKEEININNLDFILGVKSNNMERKNITDIYYLNIGLDILSSQNEKYNFINLLKERKIIDNYNWFIMFEKIRAEDKVYSLKELQNIKTKLIIGCTPHDYSPELFSENNLLSDYSSTLNFQNIYYYVNDTEYNKKERRELSSLYHDALIDINCFTTIAPYEYKRLIQEDYFNNYISKNICHYYYDQEIEGFYCDKSDKFNITNLKLFPTLYFKHNHINFTFEFNYQDLFVEEDNKYWFLIVIENGDLNEWFFGFSLLKKYQFIFNQDTKRISFYTQYNKEEPIKDDKDNDGILNGKTLYIILIIISWIIFIIIGFLLGKFLCKKYHEKKRANELDDDNYEYISDENNNNNIIN